MTMVLRCTGLDTGTPSQDLVLRDTPAVQPVYGAISESQTPKSMLYA